jgi:hypothetical protein
VGALRRAIAIVCGGLAVAAAATSGANAQALGYGCSVFGRHPCAPAPSLCGPFSHGRPCLPYNLPPLSEDLRLTIVSTDDSDAAAKAAAANAAAPEPNRNGDKDEKDAGTESGALNTISAMFAALRACWVPPPRDEAFRGMQYTVRFALKRDGEMIAPPRVTYASHEATKEVRDIYRDAVNAALARCVPLHFTKGMGGAVAGRPIAIRFVDDRTIGGDKTQQ